MITQADLRGDQKITQGLKKNPVANFSYTDTAFNNDDVDGVDAFDVSAENNIPKADHTDYNPTIIQKGVRTQAGSIPRNAWNHFIGRISYNVNKVVQVLERTISNLSIIFTHNCFEYDSTARYRKDDCCYIFHVIDGLKVYSVFRRNNGNPVEQQGYSPLLEGQTEWDLITERTGLNILKVAQDYTDNGDTSTLTEAKKYSDIHRDKEILDHPAGSVTTSKIKDEAITTCKLANKAVTNDKIAEIELSDDSLSYTLFSVAKKSLWETLQEIRNNLKALFNVMPPVGSSYDQGPNDMEPEERYPGTSWRLWNERAETYDLITNTAYNNLFSSTPSNWVSSASISANAYRIWIPGGMSASGTRRIMKCIKAVTSQKPSDINWINWEELPGVTRKARYEIQDFATTFSTDLAIGASVTISGTVYRVVGINTWSGLFASYAGVNRPTFLSGGIGKASIGNHSHNRTLVLRETKFDSTVLDYGQTGDRLTTNIGATNVNFTGSGFLSIGNVDQAVFSIENSVVTMSSNKWRRVN